MKGIFEIDPDRFLQKSVLDRRCISPCLKPDNDANVPDPKFHYCFTSPWMMKFDKSSDEYFPENQMFSWDMCSHRHCEAKKCTKTKLSVTPWISIKCNIFLYFSSVPYSLWIPMQRQVQKGPRTRRGTNCIRTVSLLLHNR